MVTPSDSSEFMCRLFHDLFRGDLSRIDELGFLEEAVFSEGLFVTEKFCVSGDTILRVIGAYIKGAVPRKHAQKWGELVRWHRFRGKDNFLIRLPFEIERGTYPEEEDLAIEMVARLDELGDIVDGEIVPGDLEALERDWKELHS